MIETSDIVLVTGGTGFTGAVLVRKLCAIGCTVRVIARASSNRSALADLPVEWVTGDVYDPAVIESAATGVSYIFHVAAAYREAKIGDEIYRKVHVDSTRLLARAARNSAALKRFVHVSTVGVLGHIDDPPADETTPYNPGDIYQDTKAEAEQWILRYAQESDLPLTVVRPAAIYGPGDRRLLKLFKMARLPVVPLIGRSRGLYHLIHVEDLTDFMLTVADHPATLGQVYICGNPEPIAIKDMIAVIAEHFGRQATFVRIPAAPVFWLASGCEKLGKLLNVEPWIYPRRIAFFTKDRAFDTRKMCRDTGFQYTYSNAEGLRETADGYVKQGWL